MTAAGARPSGPADRQAIEAASQLAGLRHELDAWMTSAASRGPLEKHHSQVRSLVTTLRDYADAAEAALSAPASGYPLRDVILDMHHIWDFFRGKLLQRMVPWHRDFLDAADEMAWACYHPARAAGQAVPQPAGGGIGDDDNGGSPPLCFLSRTAAPLAVPRGEPLRPLLSDRAGLHTVRGAAAAGELPFPMVGLPWSQTEHIPALVLLAHEAGHHLHSELGLADELATTLAAAGLAERWPRSWQMESFADVCGVLACGEAYVGLLLDELAVLAGRSAGAAQAGNYPPMRRRGLLCLAALELTGFPARAALLRAEWLVRTHALTACGGDAPGRAPDPAAETDDAHRVAGLLLRTPLARLGGPPREVLANPELARLSEAAQFLLARMSSGTRDVRSVVAAAGLAFLRDPRGYALVGVHRQALREIIGLRPPGVRADQGEPAGSPATGQGRRRASGRDLFARVAAQYPPSR
ncbi:conserved hypothetical protein [Frankia sp. AiPs1]|uniref:hypothetical protein n=1 Tax=Frankia sp. AiPa1 TaxID=573492 RepID=UPI00202ADE6B|nr:hypothetical protein [Frankia sp. AiPa1]MCL9760255.1 hypothetical protein [Frankia sp. AiPa1]